MMELIVAIDTPNVGLQMDAEAALQKTSDALKRVWQLIDV
jgi:hypothetical protein